MNHSRREMARKTKQGIDYFPLDVDFDDNVELFLLEKEYMGLAVLIITWQLIYKNDGYYIRNNDDLYLMIKKRISLDIENIKNCILSAVKRGIFNEVLHKKYKILTSSGIQKRYFDAGRKKKEIKITPEFILISISDYDNMVKVGINGVDSGGNATKENRREQNKNKIEYRENVSLLESEYGSLIKKFGLDFTEKCMDKLNSYKGSNGKKYKSDYLAILNWVVESVKGGINGKGTSKQRRKDYVSGDEYVTERKKLYEG
jgi:hypothetical protein